MEYRRRYEPDDPTDDPPDDRVDLRVVADVVCSRGSDEDRATFREVRPRFNLLSEGPHPSGQAITQMLDPATGKRLFRAHYIGQFCEHGFNHGLSTHAVLLREVNRLGHHDPCWGEVFDHLVRGFERYRLAMQPVLDETERAQAERRTRKRPAGTPLGPPCGPPRAR